MTITATCGHRIPDNSEEHFIKRKGYNREGRRCISHEVVCLRCKWTYHHQGDLLTNEAEEQAWVRYEEA